MPSKRTKRAKSAGPAQRGRRGAPTAGGGEGEEIRTQPQLARALGWGCTTLRDRLADVGCPVPRRGPWSAAQVARLTAWAAERYSRHAADAEQVRQARCMVELARAEKLQLANEEKRIKLELLKGTLLPRESVHRLLGRLAALWKGMSERLQSQPRAEARAIADETLEEFVREVADWGKAGGNGEALTEAPKRKRK